MTQLLVVYILYAFRNTRWSDFQEVFSSSLGDTLRQTIKAPASRSAALEYLLENIVPRTDAKFWAGSLGWSKHIIRIRSHFFNPRSTSLFDKVTVYARDDAALADIESAVHKHCFRKVKQI